MNPSPVRAERRVPPRIPWERQRRAAAPSEPRSSPSCRPAPPSTVCGTPETSYRTVSSLPASRLANTTIVRAGGIPGALGKMPVSQL
jgi:hypothetical protein